MGRNGLKLNISKTKYMLFSNRNTRDINVEISANSIERKQTERFLGVIIDDKLTFKQHRATLASKIARNAGVIYKVKGIVPLHVIKTLYNSFIQSHLVYCSNVWGLGSKNSVARIFSAQKRAIRVVKQGFVRYFYKKDTGELPAHTKNIFAENEFLTIHNLIAQQAVAFMQKVSAHIVPKPTFDNFELLPRNDQNDEITLDADNHSERNSLSHHPKRLLNFIRDSNAENLTIMHPRRATDFFKTPKIRLMCQQNSIFYKGPKLYNMIVNDINSSLGDNDTRLQKRYIKPFKNLVKRHLLEAQNLGSHENWTLENFKLYNI